MHQGVATQKSRSIHLPDLAKLANEGSPWTKTRIYAVEPRPASAEGTLPDVRGRRADAYRHCVVVGCRLRMVSTIATEILWSSCLRRSADAALDFLAGLATFLRETSALW